MQLLIVRAAGMEASAGRCYSKPLFGAPSSQILVSVIGGPPSPYTIELVPVIVGDNQEMRPEVRPSCTEVSGEFAQPGVRLAALVTAFGRNGVYMPACAPSFAPAFLRIAEEMGKVRGPRCLEDMQIRSSGQPECMVSQQRPDDRGQVDVTSIPSCQANRSTLPCWTVRPAQADCPGGVMLSIVLPDGSSLPPGTIITVSCP